MEKTPPRWATRFLEWYCHPRLLEEIQGDLLELYERDLTKSRLVANVRFVWRVIRFFRLENMKKNNIHKYLPFHPAMLKNILKISVRSFLRYPGHSLTNITGLAAGFTCAMLILLWVMHEFAYDQFHSNKTQLYEVVTHVDADGSIQTHPVAGFNMDVSSVPEIESVTRISTGTRWPNESCFRPSRNPDDCVYFNGVYADPSLFVNFNFPILKGDASPLNDPNQIAISETMARTLYAGEDPVGKHIKIDDHFEVEIVSVFRDVPTESSIQFDFAMPFNVVMKLWGVDENMMKQQFFDTYVKTVQPVDAAALTAKLNDEKVIGADYKSQKVSYQAIPFQDWHLHSKFENGVAAGGRIEYVHFFIVIGALILLLAVINFVNMATARSTLRAREIGIRKVTGALRGSIMLQFMGESFLIVLIAFGVACGATYLAIPFFNQLIGEPISTQLLDGRIVVYAAGLLIFVALLSGFYPSLIVSSFQPAEIMKGTFSVKQASPMSLRKMLMVVQLSVSVAIMIFSGVLYKQLDFITQINLGFDRKNTIRLEPTYKLLKSYDAFKNNLMSNPVIAGVGASNANPLNAGGGTIGVSWPGKPEDLRVSFQAIGCTFDFPKTIGLQLLEGRMFEPTPGDSLHGEVLITPMAAKTMNLKDPIGTVITIGNNSCRVIGMVNDFNTTSLHESMAPAILQRTDILHISAIYVKYEAGKAQEALALVNEAYRKLEPSFTMKYWFQDDEFDNLYKTEILISRLVLIFSVVTLVIAGIGIAGLATFNVMRKKKEISLRRVFGATVPETLWVLVREFSWVLLLSLSAGIPVAWYASHQWLEGFAYRTATPWWIFVGSTAGVLLLVTAIVWILGQKTIATNPVQTLRNE